jgi:hypothetical protein
VAGSLAVAAALSAPIDTATAPAATSNRRSGAAEPRHKRARFDIDHSPLR